MKLNKQSLKDMKAKWSANKGKLKACRKDFKVKGLARRRRSLVLRSKTAWPRA